MQSNKKKLSEGNRVDIFFKEHYPLKKFDYDIYFYKNNINILEITLKQVIEAFKTVNKEE